MDQKINISIKKPCSENFNNFQFTATGGYCASCQKEVIDFTKMTQEEIQNYFKIPKTNTCGYFLESQLKIDSNNDYVKIRKINSFGVPFIAASLLSLFAFNASFAQKKSELIETTKIPKEDIDTENKDSIDDGKHVISGVVLDENKIPLPGINISLKDKRTSITTDLDGEFTFPKRLKKGDKLVISCIGFETLVLNVSNTSLRIILKENHTSLLGEVSVNQTYKSKISFLDKLKNLFR